MKQIYKVLISILIISILAETAISATTGQTAVGGTTQYSAIFDKPEVWTNMSTSTPWLSTGWVDIADYTFYLPTNAFARIEGNGMLYGYQAIAGSMLEVDGVNSTTRFYGAEGLNGGWTGFSNPKTLYLSKGNHRIRIYGVMYGQTPGFAGSYAGIDVIANSQGNIAMLTKTDSIPPITPPNTPAKVKD